MLNGYIPYDTISRGVWPHRGPCLLRMHVYTAACYNNNNMLKETERPVYIDLVALILVNQTFEVRIKRMIKLLEHAIILSGTKKKLV